MTKDQEIAELRAENARLRHERRELKIAGNDVMGFLVVNATEVMKGKSRYEEVLKAWNMVLWNLID